MKLATFCGLVALAVGGCVAQDGPGKTLDRSSYASDGQVQSAIPASLAQSAAGYMNGPSLTEYRVGPYDVVNITVFNVPELTGDFQVGPNGRMALPLIGEVTAAGRTPQQLQAEISKTLGKTYLQSPQVSVTVKDYKSQHVTVEGAVNKAGVFPMSGSTTLLQAIALAEGPTRYATPEDILVFRSTNGQRSVARFNLQEIRVGKMDDPTLQGGDVVVVTESATKSNLRDLLMALPVASLFLAIL